MGQLLVVDLLSAVIVLCGGFPFCNLWQVKLKHNPSKILKKIQIYSEMYSDVFLLAAHSYLSLFVHARRWIQNARRTESTLYQMFIFPIFHVAFN